jgi:hypothetical protein
MELVEGVSFIDWVRPATVSGPTRTRADILATPVHEVRLRGALVQLVALVHSAIIILTDQTNSLFA